MRTLLLQLCGVALLAGCADDKTEGGGTPPVVGNAQFAAAVDDLFSETRASLVNGVTTWEASDRVGITAMVDGTPYVKNVPYEFTAATSFGELTAVDDPILWNESVAGERSFFACWPYDVADDAFEEMSAARFNFSIPSEQRIIEGVNTTKPMLIGVGKTTAQAQHPVALRFKNLFPVVTLRFDAFAETSIAQIVIEPAQDALFEGYLATTGVVTSLGQMTLNESGKRITLICDSDGLDIAEGASVQIPVGRFIVAGGLKFTALTTDGRTFSELVFGGDEPFCSYVADASGAFSRAKYIEHTMQLEVISDDLAEGVVYFEDDLNWISKDARWTSTMTGGGWPTVTSGATSATGLANSFTVDLIAEFAAKGYVKSTNRTSVQARYEGYLCLGTTSAQGGLITPALAELGAVPTDILVSFYGATYASEGLVADGKPLTIRVLNAGSIDGDASTEVEITNYYGWRKYWIIVRGATSETQIRFGKDVNTSAGRVLIDNIQIGKAVKGAVAGSRDVSGSVVPSIKTLELAGKYNYEIENAKDATGVCIIQSNQSWIAATEADWVTVAPVVEYNATGIAYKVVVTSQSLNTTGKMRTADVIFTAGELTKTVVFTQSEMLPEVVIFEDDFAWCNGDGTTGGIFDATLSNSTTIGAGGKQYKDWTAEYKTKGWTTTLAVNSPVTRGGTLLCGGTVTLPADIVSPAFAAIGDVPMDIVVEYDVLAYKNASETGKSVLTVQGGGAIKSIEGHYTTTPNDAWTRLSDDGVTQYYYCGNYGGWTGGASWHHIRVVIEGATKATTLRLWTTEGYSRFWLDNFKVTPSK